MDWHSKRVLVTGAGGFIGSHLTERLVDLGATVRAFVFYNALGTRGWLENSPVRDQIEFRVGDICDQNRVRRAVEGIDIVFHLAALIGIAYSYDTSCCYVRTNVEGTVNVLQAAHDHGVDRIVHTSTSEVYGTAQYVPIDENHPTQAQSPYAASKIAGDKMAEAFLRSFDVPVVTVRPFNTYGLRQSKRAVIPTIILQAFESDAVKLGNIHPTRDFTFVDDTVEAFVKAAEAEGVVGKTINVGSGTEVSIGDLANQIIALVGRDVPIVADEVRVRREGSEVERLLCDNSKAKELLGWQPRYSLEEGLRKTIEWWSEPWSGHRVDQYDPRWYST